MRKLISMAAAAAFVTALALPVFAADMTIKGTVVCFPDPKEPVKEAPDAVSAMACAKKGMPLGVRTADTVFHITGDYLARNNAKLLDFVTRTVIAAGEVSEKDGQKVMNLKSIKLPPVVK